MITKLTPATHVMASHNVRIHSESTQSLPADMQAIAKRAADTFPEMTFHNALIADNSRTLLEDRHCFIGYSQIDATSFDLWVKSRADEHAEGDEVARDACDNACDSVQDDFYGMFDLTD